MKFEFQRNEESFFRISMYPRQNVGHTHTKQECSLLIWNVGHPATVSHRVGPTWTLNPTWPPTHLTPCRLTSQVLLPPLVQGARGPPTHPAAVTGGSLESKADTPFPPTTPRFLGSGAPREQGSP